MAFRFVTNSGWVIEVNMLSNIGAISATAKKSGFDPVSVLGTSDDDIQMHLSRGGVTATEDEWSEFNSNFSY